MPVLILATTLAFLAIAVEVDVRRRRIPNIVTASGMLVGLLLNAIYFGTPGLLASTEGLLLATALLLPPFALGGIGGGDVKMMAAVGALLGPACTLGALLLGLCLGGAAMAVHLARHGRLREKLATIRAMLAAALLTGSPWPLRLSAGDPDAVALPYSVPLGLGTLAALALSGHGGPW